MNEPARILDELRRRCQSLGLDPVKVADIQIDGAPLVMHLNFTLFLERARKSVKVIYWRRNPNRYDEKIDDDGEDGAVDIETLMLMFMSDGVASVLEVEQDGIIQY